ncbi:hypothetical protein [Algoriphagus formosus]|uniref:Uncharacterized protein n=1 Tax=Algoriphagus formosus TaxID=2007308 RepID=A0A4R5V7A7_9BACT|nr:hypothetical protein [Algoriphagus aquimaris]TDK47943.1 hypothetical protein E1898_04525 [Algoriphagus aquimaris]
MNFEKTKQGLVLIAGIAVMAGFISKQTFTKTNPQSMKPVYELAINQSKDGQHQQFLDSREKFVEVLGKESATLNEGKWAPFFTVAPDLPLEQILIGMTHWNSMAGFGEAAARLMPQPVATDYFSSFNPLAYALLEPVDGQPFDMESIKKTGNVVEFAIRKGKTVDSFGEKREAFFKSLENFDGYEFAREFKVYKLNEQGMPNLAENTQAVIIVWENGEKFQAAAPQIFPSKPYVEFAEMIEVESYFAAFPSK